LAWVLTVSGLSVSWRAISVLDIPSATRATTSRSRSVRVASSGEGRTGSLSCSARNLAMRPRVADGESSASPRGRYYDWARSS
jgi:hypothetical protein